MSKYTTGEMAKICDVSVRTVQYYDTRGILCPSTLSEGGRRLYAEDDLRKLKIICFLRSLDIPINSIGELLKEEKPQNVISLLLKQQQQALSKEVKERQEKLQKLEELMWEAKNMEHFSIESIGDIAYKMENKKKLQKVRRSVIVADVFVEIIEAATLVLGIAIGIWWPFVVGMCLAVALVIGAATYYHKRTAYICPECHTVFKPKYAEVFWAPYTSSTRKLTCTDCGHKGFCVETYGMEPAEEVF